LQQLADRENRKAEIVARLKGWSDELQVLGCQAMHPARRGQIADHVIADGFPEAELWKILADAKTDFLAGRCDSPGGVFHRRFTDALQLFGISPRTKRSKPR
jgi:hypothetical protein